MSQPKSVFCSHRGVDKAEVGAFAAKLRELGIDAWFDTWEIAAGADIVASMNRGLDECDVGLLFFSSKPWPGQWFENELSSMVVRRNEDGVRLIPVMIDPDVTVPALLRPLARRSIDQLDQIVDAINGVSRKPKLGEATVARRTARFTLRLVGPKNGVIDLAAVRNGVEVARETGVRLTRTLQQSYAEFPRAHTKLALRGPSDAAHQSLSRALGERGEALGRVLFATHNGAAPEEGLKDVTVSEALELCFEASDSMLLALPFEAARLGGVVPALKAGVTVRRIVAGTTPITRRAEYLDGILRKGNARLPIVAERLRAAAKKAGVPLTSDAGGLDEALRNTVLLGAREILLAWDLHWCRTPNRIFRAVSRAWPYRHRCDRPIPFSRRCRSRGNRHGRVRGLSN